MPSTPESTRKISFPLEGRFDKVFAKEWDGLQKSGKHDMLRIREAINLLQNNDRPIPDEWHPHPLKQKEFDGCDCIRVKGDLDLIYKLEGKVIIFKRIGTHAQLFKRMS